MKLKSQKRGKPASTMEQSVVCVNRKPNGIQSVLHGPRHICHNSTVSIIVYKLYKSDSYVISESKIEIIDCNFVSRQKGGQPIGIYWCMLGVTSNFVASFFRVFFVASSYPTQQAGRNGRKHLKN